MTGEESGVIGFEYSERCIEHFPTRHDDDVEAANIFSPPEELTGPTFRPVALDGGTKFPGRRHAKPWRRGPVGHDEHRHEPAVDLGAGTVNPLELRAAANPLRRRQTLIFHAGAREALSLPLVSNGQALATLRTAPFEHNSAVFRRHSYPEAMRLLAATGVGLVGALPLHDVLSAARIKRSGGTKCERQRSPAELSILVVA